MYIWEGWSRVVMLDINYNYDIIIFVFLRSSTPRSSSRDDINSMAISSHLDASDL